MENMSRRKFLKLGALSAGLVTLAGCATIKNTPIGGGTFEKSTKEEAAGKWGMFIDMEMTSLMKGCRKNTRIRHLLQPVTTAVSLSA